MKRCNSIAFIFCFLISVLVTTAQNIKYHINSDGSFSIKGSAVQINDCYPAIDGRMVKPIGISILAKDGQDIIRYKLVNGSIELSLKYVDNAVAISTSVSSESVYGNFISPIHDAIVAGATRIYRTPTHIMGNGGIKDWPTDKMDFSSCGNATGLIPITGATMVVSTRDFSKFSSYTNCLPTANNGGKKLMDISIATEKIYSKVLPTIFITENESAFEAMRNEALQIAKQANVKNNKPPSYHWCSWYYAYYHLTEQLMSDYLKGFKSLQPNVPIQTVQIDAGYFPHPGDWLEPHYRFPNGIEKSVKEIISNNYKAGIWIGPYMVGNKSKLYKDHPDWVLCRTDGKPIVNMQFYGEERLWGAMDEEIYTLDTSNPAVMEYLRKVFRAFRKMGITFFKTDFMLYGSESSNNVKRFTPGKTSIEYQHDLYKMIREEIGQDAYWLGCIAPYVPMLGYADGMRISGDISPTWAGGKNMFEETVGAQHFNNIWWQNDPDAIILREKYNWMSDEEAKSMILWMGMLGGVVNTSDLFHEIPKKRVDLFRFIEPSNEKAFATLPFIDQNSKFDIMVRKYPAMKSCAVLFVNRSTEKAKLDYKIEQLSGMLQATCFDWNEQGSQEIGKKETITIELNAHESKLIYISEDGKGPGMMTLGGKQK